MVNAFIEAVYDALAAGTSLQTAIGGTATDKKIYHVIARQDATFPYIVIGLLTDVPVGVFGALDNMEDVTIYVNIFSDSGSAKEAGDILDLVKAVLDDDDLTIAGYANDMKCMREFVGPILYDSDIKVFQIPTRYRIWAEKD